MEKRHTGRGNGNVLGERKRITVFIYCYASKHPHVRHADVTQQTGKVLARHIFGEQLLDPSGDPVPIV